MNRHKLLFAICLLLLSGSVLGQIPYFDGSYWGLISREGEILTAPCYDSIPRLLSARSDTFVFKMTSEGSVFLADEHKNILLSGYDDYSVLDFPLLRVQKGNKYGLYNFTTSRGIIEPQYDDITSDYSLEGLGISG